MDRVTIASLYEYNLFLRPDTNTRGHTQWFYFAVTNTEKGKTVTFHILNCAKPFALLKSGMTPVSFSEIDCEENNIGWTTETFNVTCQKNNIPAQEDHIITKQNYYTLSFSYKFKYSSDRVYFALGKPYSVTMLKSQLMQIKEKLFGCAKNIVPIEKGTLQNKIRKFIDQDCKMEEKTNKQNMKKEKINNVPILDSAKKLLSDDVDIEIETESFIYREETLCHTLIKFPVQLITITALKYLKHFV